MAGRYLLNRTYTRIPLKQFTYPSLQQRVISTAMTSRIIDTIKTDHREIEDYYNKVLSSTTDKEKIQWQNQFTWELARHSIGEELVVYPQFEKNLPDGHAMADKDRKEHQSASQPSITLFFQLANDTVHCRLRNS
jgi:hypothetical protein